MFWKWCKEYKCHGINNKISEKNKPENNDKNNSFFIFHY